MGLEIWFAEDIRNALLAADEANLGTVALAARLIEDPVELRAYREGYKAALTTVALAFGVAPADVRGSVEEPAGIPAEFREIGDSDGQPGG